MKKVLVSTALFVVLLASILYFKQSSLVESKNETQSEVVLKPIKIENRKKKTVNEKEQFSIERLQYDYDLYKNPNTGLLSKEDQTNQLVAALEIQSANFNRSSSNTYESRGPSNLGGRTRSLVIDISDPTSNTILAGGVSSGVFRTTDGGQNWNRVSSNNDIHNVTSIAQDPRPGFQNIWYYGTGEFAGNSATLGSFFLGQGVYRSTNSGLNWELLPETDSVFEDFDSDFDVIHKLAVSPTTGDLYIATINSVYRYNETSINEILIANSQNAQTFTDVVTDASGRIYATIGGDESNTNGVYLSEDDGDTFIRIAQNGNPTGWASSGRTVLATAPSNDNFLYALFNNGANSGANQIEADLWRYDRSTDTWEDFSATLPDLPGGPIAGVDPFSIQGGYDIVVSVSFEDENYVAIGGSSAYRIRDIENDPMFEIIGGYNGAQTALYNTPNGDEHHPDVHALVFDPFNPDVFFSGTDGGVHRTDNIDADMVDWVNLNNNYQTYQYYDVFLDQQEGSNIVIGGAQDNGTTAGGTDGGLPDNTEMLSIFGGDGVSVGFGRPDNGDFIGYLGTQFGSILRINFTTGSFVSIRPAAATANGLFVTLFHVDPDNTDAVYYANQNNLFRTTSGSTVNATTWDNLGTVAGGQILRSFATTRGEYNPDTSYMLIGTQNGGVFRLDDPQNATNTTNAINITPTDATTTGGTVVNAMAIHPTNPDIAMAVYANFGVPSIFITNDATSDDPTWTLVENNLAPFSVRAAQIVEVDGQLQYFVGTARGLFSNNDPLNNDWMPEGVDQFGIPVISDLEYRPSDGILLIGTHGNGMYQTETQTLSIDDINDNSERNSLSIYPNPAENQLNFRMSSPGITFNSFEIIDSFGRVVAGNTLDNTTEQVLDVSSYTSGVYFLKVVTQSNQVVVSKFLKK